MPQGVNLAENEGPVCYICATSANYHDLQLLQLAELSGNSLRNAAMGR